MWSCCNCRRIICPCSWLSWMWTCPWLRPSAAVAMVVVVWLFFPLYLSQACSVVAWWEEGTQQSTGGKYVGKWFSSVETVSLLFCFSFSIQISHELPFICGHSGIFCVVFPFLPTFHMSSFSSVATVAFLRWPLSRTDGDCVPWRRAAPGRSKGVWGRTQEDQGRMGRRPLRAPSGRTKDMWGGDQKDQGCVGWRPWRIHEVTGARRTKGTFGGTREDDNRSSRCLN